MTMPSVKLDLEQGTISRHFSDSRTCHTAVLHSRYRRVYLGHIANFDCTLEVLLFTYWITTSAQYYEL